MFRTWTIRHLFKQHIKRHVFHLSMAIYPAGSESLSFIHVVVIKVTHTQYLPYLGDTILPEALQEDSKDLRYA